MQMEYSRKDVLREYIKLWWCYKIWSVQMLNK